MNSSEQFKHYTDKVCEQIRWKKAHGMVAKEIENHLIDQKNAYMNMGDSESTAEEKALLQMGDPVSIGAALDSTHKPAPQWGMIGLVMLLFILGLIIQYKLTTIHTALEVKSDSIPYQFALYAIGLAAFIGTYYLDFSFLRKHPYLPFILLLGIDFWMQISGAQVYGQRWFLLGPFSISSVSLSLLFPFAFCGMFYRLREKGKNGYFRSGVIAALFCCLLLTCHTIGGLAVFVFSAGILMIVAVQKNWFGQNTKPILALFITAAIVCIGILLFTVQFRYRLFRVTAILHPETDPAGTGYLSGILQDMMKNSVLFGEGTPFLDYDVTYAVMPSTFRSDYLLTYLTYKYGWIASLALIALLLAFLCFGFYKCLKQKSILGQMVSLAILCTFAAELLLYVAANLGYPLIAPIALPFLSYGGTALIIHMALAGILLSVFRTGEVYQDNTKPILNESKFIQWDDGKLIISFK